MEFAAALRAAREDAGLSIAGAAEVLGVSHNALGGWELGRRKKRLPRATVERLEEIYDIADQRLLRAGGYAGAGELPPSGRTSLSYGGEPLTGSEESAVLDYIDFVRSKRPR
jgi:transcriptional regulator with XRE-family HTH domain